MNEIHSKTVVAAATATVTTATTDKTQIKLIDTNELYTTLNIHIQFSYLTS